jgi:hypothetical protein
MQPVKQTNRSYKYQHNLQVKESFIELNTTILIFQSIFEIFN